MQKHSLRLLLTTGLVASLSACVVQRYPEPQGPNQVVPFSAPTAATAPAQNYAPAPIDSSMEAPLAESDVPPPPPQVEVLPEAPFLGAIWLPGYWNWVGGRFFWVRGHWDRPRPGQEWHAHQWVQQGSTWRLQAGHWKNRR